MSKTTISTKNNNIMKEVTYKKRKYHIDILKEDKTNAVHVKVNKKIGTSYTELKEKIYPYHIYDSFTFSELKSEIKKILDGVMIMEDVNFEEKEKVKQRDIKFKEWDGKLS